MKICYGDKSKYIKSALIRAVQGIERNENDNRLICEMNTRRTVIQETMTGEADRVINAIKLIVRDEWKLRSVLERFRKVPVRMCQRM